MVKLEKEKDEGQPTSGCARNDVRSANARREPRAVSPAPVRTAVRAPHLYALRTLFLVLFLGSATPNPRGLARPTRSKPTRDPSRASNTRILSSTTFPNEHDKKKEGKKQRKKYRRLADRRPRIPVSISFEKNKIRKKPKRNESTRLKDDSKESDKREKRRERERSRKMRANAKERRNEETNEQQQQQQQQLGD